MCSAWAGAAYDLTIAYFLLFPPTRVLAYIGVVVFHGLTYVLFNIGLFPLIMIFSTLVFFSSDFHDRLLGGIAQLLAKLKTVGKVSQGTVNGKRQTMDDEKWMLNYVKHTNIQTHKHIKTKPPQTTIKQSNNQTITTILLSAYISLQLLLPFRHFLYDGDVLWTEEGYRFSWRVMLVEKIGQVRFFVADEETNRKTEIVNGQHLTLFQEKQMSIQPDFILQFAHFLAEEYKSKHGMKNPSVTVDAHVALNGRTSQQFIDSQVNLAAVEDGFEKKKWILPFK